VKKDRWRSSMYHVCLACNCMLVFLALFGTHLDIPAWLQVSGRMHPLLLHFPVACMVLAAVWETTTYSRNEAFFKYTGDWLLLLTATSAGLSALTGLFLSNEGGYNEDSLLWHRWSGLLVSWLAFGWYVLRKQARDSRMRTTVVSVAGFVLIVLAGHLGATLTHGENYLLAPITLEKQPVQVALEDALVFQDVVQPVLKEKCMSCHNARKSKGDLNMESEATLLQGGKNGALWDSSAAGYGHLLRRIHLPIAEKEHMPPQGKPQLSEEEVRILYFWIKNGASFTQKVIDLPENDTLRMLATARLQAAVVEQFDFPAADESTIRQLNNDFRTVYPLATNSPALTVDFFGKSAFNIQSLHELDKVKTQIVHLNLNKMPVQDADLSIIGRFSNLRKLNLAGSAITGATLGELKNLHELRQLTLSGTPVKADQLDVLRDLPKLSVVHLWNTGVTEADLADLRQRMPQVRFESGFSGEGVVAQLNAPIIESPTDVFYDSARVVLKNFIPGAVVRYTLDGSIPDSLNSPVFKGDTIVIHKNCVLNSKTFLPGWTSSVLATRTFFKVGITPDSVALITQPDPQYRALGAETLINHKIGDTDYKTNKWIGYRETPLVCMLFFKRPTLLSSAYISALAHIGNYVMPPAEIQIWGGDAPNHLVLLHKMRPEQPTKLAKYRVGYECAFTPRALKVMKIILKPVAKLPAWHPQKGEKGWVFMDEVFLN